MRPYAQLQKYFIQTSAHNYTIYQHSWFFSSTFLGVKDFGTLLEIRPNFLELCTYIFTISRHLALCYYFLLLIEMCHHKLWLSDHNTSARYDSCRMKIVHFMYEKKWSIDVTYDSYCIFSFIMWSWLQRTIPCLMVQVKQIAFLLQW